MSNYVSRAYDLSINEQAFGVFFPYDSTLIAGLTKEQAEEELRAAAMLAAQGWESHKGTRLVYGGFVDADLL